MSTITTEELAKFRSALQHDEEAMKSLNMVEKCHGNLDEAMEIMMARAGMEPKRGGDYWDKIIKELRHFICDPDFKDFFINDAYALALGFLLAKTTHPATILILVILYIFRKGISHFCQSEQVA
ncbi:MAG: hypothetical protein VSS75_018560 [Candidatus Parabeggiatoa sp.]|nr:hypothetical protein [Candidatus Parabeggiatoa sp.]